MEGVSAQGLAGRGRFTLRRELGRGAMGVIYEAFDADWSVPVAVKTLRAMAPEALLRLKNEFRAVEGIYHPNLVRLGELLEDNGRWLFTMELVDGEELVRWVRHDGACDHARLRDGL
ncbi:MAG TPA: protein kinase, partial [Polyangia bacterium]